MIRIYCCSSLHSHGISQKTDRAVSLPGHCIPLFQHGHCRLHSSFPSHYIVPSFTFLSICDPDFLFRISSFRFLLSALSNILYSVVTSSSTRFIFSIPYIIRHACTDMTCQKHFIETIQCRIHSRYLYKNIRAIGTIFNHSPNSPDLPFNPAQIDSLNLYILFPNGPLSCDNIPDRLFFLPLYFSCRITPQGVYFLNY